MLKDNFSNTASNDDTLLTARQSAALLGVSLATFRRRVADHTIPDPLKIGEVSRWPKHEILGVIEAAKAVRVNV